MTSSKPIQSVGPSRAAVRAGITAAERITRDRMRRLMAAYRRVERIFQNGEPMAAAVAVFALAASFVSGIVLCFFAAVLDAAFERLW
jgi:hypothetical protein